MKSSKRVPLYTQICEYLLDNIKQKKWKPDDKIPSENELAEQFQVSRLTVKNAMQELIDRGLIVRIQGKGTFVASDNSNTNTILFRSDTQQYSGKLAALIMPRIDNMHTIHLFNGIESALAQNGYKLIVCKSYDSQELETQLLHDLVEMGVSGIIVYPVEGESYNEEILKLVMNRYPIVVIDRYLKGIETNCVVSDNMEGAYNATTHLIELGHTKIGFATTQFTDTTSAEDRLKGYEKALAEHQIPYEFRFTQTNLLPEGAKAIFHDEDPDEKNRQLIRDYLAKNPDLTAILTLNCGVGLIVLQIAMEMGFRIPEQLSLIFFDDDIPPYSLIRPTCIKQDENLIGTEATKLLFSLIENPKQERKKIVVPTHLIVRNTTSRI